MLSVPSISRSPVLTVVDKFCIQESYWISTSIQIYMEYSLTGHKNSAIQNLDEGNVFDRVRQW